MRRRPHLHVLVSFRGWIALARRDPRLRPVPVPVYASRSSFSFRPFSSGVLACSGSRQHSGWGGWLDLPTQFFRSGPPFMFSCCRACSVWRDFHPLRCSASLVAHPIWILPPDAVVPNPKCETRNLKQIQPLQECSGSFSLSGIKVQSTQMEEDVRLEALFVPIAKGLFYQTLDFIV